MRAKTSSILGATLIFLLLMNSCRKDGPQICNCNFSDTAVVSVFSNGFNNPRGLKFGPDGNLYVAEGGTGGTDSTVGTCDQVPAPVGPYTGSATGARISKVDHSGTRSTFVDGLPSSETSVNQGNLVSGVADVAFLGRSMYAILAGAGCSHGVPSVPNGIVKIKDDGTWSLLANLSAYQQAHPTQTIEPDDFEPDGTWYSMISAGDDLFAVEPNHGEMVKVNRHGDIKRVIDISASEGHIVPTALAAHDGNFYIGNLNPFPIQDGASNIYQVTPGGQISVWATGFTTVLGITFDRLGRMYVLENTTGNPFPTPGTGKVIRVNRDGSKETIVNGLSLPTGITYGPDDRLYISNWGFGPPIPGVGQILQVTLPCPNPRDGGNQHK